MKGNKKLEFESMCVHAGIEEYEFNPIVPPIYQTSTFKFNSVEQGASLFRGEESGYIYTRLSNPTIEAMENGIAKLENGYKALGCASGIAAIFTTFTSLLESGDNVVCSKAIYESTAKLLKTIFKKFGVTTSFVDSTKTDNIKNAITDKTKIIFIETPSNPVLDLTDLEAASKLAHENNAVLVVDNTFMSPVLQQPINFGADIVIHSMTKYLNGHADVIAGIIVVNNEGNYKIFKETLIQIGGVIGPFNSFLVHRGVKTLALRMKQHSENALIIAEYLENHHRIEWVRYPGLKSFPQYKLAIKQHRLHGGMIAFEVKGGSDAGKKLLNSVELCLLAVSLGGVETLIQHPASMTHSSLSKEERESAGITEGLIRLSVGIENVNDLISDLDKALDEI